MNEDKLQEWFGGVVLVPCPWWTPHVAEQITADVRHDLREHYAGIPAAENVFLPAR